MIFTYRSERPGVKTLRDLGALGLHADFSSEASILAFITELKSHTDSLRAIAAAVRGLPVKLVFIASARPQFDLIARPEIRSVAELRARAGELAISVRSSVHVRRGCLDI